jgi:excisionase family DNA binding protein
MAAEWITTQEAAELSGYHPEYIRRLVRQGKIQAELKGPMFWISKASFLKFLHEAQKSSQHDKRHGPKRR